MSRILKLFIAMLLAVGAMAFATAMFSGGYNCLPFKIFCADSA